ncbi:hypothetical protein [Dactylosporangium matsuzakiense]|uniref:hypothetical protein n=1 Tax=Dactylosporangium matsuzakiense TaxID=53360 RepID=UPI0021C33DC4|nr:hypothetical protein [Dactylosporangium matsuzakiense]UWZ46469.1 hypothetical protein Dmats_08610 [Dactylosporangium matsuzakiense]
MNIRFALPVALPGLLLAATALAGCADEAEPITSAPPASTKAVVPVSEAASPPKAPSSKAASGGAASGAASGCPVTAAVLEKAFKANKQVADAILLGKGFKDVSCYGGWATATATPENMDQAVVLFKYDAAKKTWAAVVGGTDGVCRDRVPDDVATHLKGCQN